MRHLFIIMLLISSRSFAADTTAAEPAYCNPKTFGQYEIQYEGNHPKRLHVYQIGHVKIAGMAVGDSKAADVKTVALTANPAVEHVNYCTFYFGDGNKEGEKSFTWRKLFPPLGFAYKSTAKKYMSKVGDLYHDNEVNFVDCAVDYGYIGLGCNAQKHRGPTMFGTLLAYGGCSPKNAAKIVNSIWGNNFIMTDMREAIAKAAADLAAKNPERAQQFRDALAGR